MEESTKLISIATFQASNIKPTGDYTQVYRTEKDGFDYMVLDYGNPKHGYWGYQVLFYEKREDGEYVKSVGYGEESKARTYDWFNLDKV